MLGNPSTLPIETPTLQPTALGCCSSVSVPPATPYHVLNRLCFLLRSLKDEFFHCMPALFLRSTWLAQEAGLKQESAHSQPTPKSISTMLLTGPICE